MFEQFRYRVGRLMSAASYAVRSGYAAYRDEDSSADSDVFDTYEARTARYRLNTMYMENKQYTPFNRLRYSSRFTKRYRHMRAIYNFVSRLIDLEVNKVYGGRIDWAGDLKTGAIPVILAKDVNPLLIECIKQILEWSNFGDGKDIYARNGASLGDSFLKAVNVFSVDENGKKTFKKVYIEVLDPHIVKDFELDERGNVIRVVIEYWDTDENGKDFEFREEIDKLWWIKYRDGEQYSKEPNILGFVPVTHTPHKHMGGGRKCGVTSFHNTLNKLDELNDGASVAKDGQRKANNPMLAVLGGKLGAPNADLRERDDLLVFEGGDADIRIETITPETDTAGAIATMEREDNEIQSDNPALALQNLRKQGGELSGVAIQNYYSDASDSLEAIQARYDERLIRILQMACTMAGMMNLPGFEWIDAGSYDRSELRFYLKERPVFSDRVPAQERLRLIMEAAQSPAWRIIAQDLELSEDDIVLVELAKRQSAADAMRGLAEGVFGEDNNSDDDPETTDETAPPTNEIEETMNANA